MLSVDTSYLGGHCLGLIALTPTGICEERGLRMIEMVEYQKKQNRGECEGADHNMKIFPKKIGGRVCR